jgi:preprotein translocase subunit SecG
VIYLLYFIHVIVCLFLVLVVLVQQGKGADLSVFGGGATMTAFGARGATTILHKMTVSAFVVFILTTLGIALVEHRSSRSSVMSGTAATPAAPVAPAPAAPTAPATTPTEPAATPAPAQPATPPPANQ